jgi:hypothetical protein
VIVAPAFGYYYGPAWYYRPWRPAYVYPVPVRGDVKIETRVKGESIYVDGGFAGVTGKLKKFSLQPGNHQIEVQDPSGYPVFQNTVHVMAGQTVEIHC